MLGNSTYAFVSNPIARRASCPQQDHSLCSGLLSPMAGVLSPRHSNYFEFLHYEQLVYQTTVFFSRSSISIGLPPLPPRLLPLPSFLQGFILVTLAYESAVGFFPSNSGVSSIYLVFILVSIEGICGGLA